MKVRKLLQSIFPKVAVNIRDGIYVILASFDRLFGRKTPVFVLSYHSIASDSWRFSVSKTAFSKQIAYLSKHYDFITLATLERYLKGKVKLDKPSVVLTFDDGYADIVSLKPLFKKYGIKPALFVLSNTKKPNWKELATKRPFLTKAQIRSLHKLGWEINVHSATHANLATLSEKDLHTEIAKAKKDIEETLGAITPYFAYPRGKYNNAVLTKVKNTKYRMALTMDDGAVTPGVAMLQIPRIGVDGTHSLEIFKTLFSPSAITFRKLVKESPIGRYL